MSDTESENDMYKIETFDDLETAKQQVLSNYVCKCCDLYFCKDCAKTNARLKMSSKSLPIDIIQNISNNIRCEKCEEMICIIKHRTLYGYDNDNFDLYSIKLAYYIDLNGDDLPRLEDLRSIPKLQNLSNRHHQVLTILYWNIKHEKQWKHWKRNTMNYFWDTNGESMEDAYDELNDLFKELIEILHYIDMNEDKRHNILYGHSFCMEIADKLNEVFFNEDSETESEGDEVREEFEYISDFHL